MENLKKARNERGISQQKLAADIGTTQQSIYNYENRKVEPDISTMIKLADYFNTSIDYLIGRKLDRKALTISSDEINLIEKYRAIPHHARKTVNDILDICSRGEFSPH